MLVSFDIKFIVQDQKQRRIGEVFYLSCIISRFNAEKKAKQMISRRSFV